MSQLGNGTHDEFMLGAYALDLLDPDENRRAGEHLADCGSCRTEYGQLIGARQTLGRIPSEWLLHGPPPGRAPLEAAMRTIRASQAAAWPRSRLALTLAAGLVGFFMGYAIQPTGTPAPPTASASSAPGVRQAGAVDPETNISLSVTVTPAMGWVRVRAVVTGIPSGEVCRLLVVRGDGSREIAGGWVTSERGETEAVVLDGGAAVPPEEVKAILVANTAGKTFIAVQF